MRGGRSGATLSYTRKGLEEDRVWAEAQERVPFLRGIPENTGRILRYALTEMVNNAIDHSRSGRIEVVFPPPSPDLSFEVVDRGVGIFDHVRRRLRLPSRLAALGEVSKGKTTTQPEKHTGEGIFFVSKIADRFEIESADLRWSVDNLRGDMAVGSVAPPRKGTRVRFEVRPEKKRTLKQLFDEYTEDFEFTRTRVVVKLFGFGVRFVSRSEAKRLLAGLHRFRDVVLDFKGVEEVGQGFADEVFRVWARSHPKVRLEPVHMVEAVDFMVRRAMK
ncbi:MAG: ArsR family transcriptional [Planctomycetota bacterium]|nr:MAG: ArsR family transcriptional [Planctomycetota bacterium]